MAEFSYLLVLKGHRLLWFELPWCYFHGLIQSVQNNQRSTSQFIQKHICQKLCDVLNKLIDYYYECTCCRSWSKWFQPRLFLALIIHGCDDFNIEDMSYL